MLFSFTVLAASLFATATAQNFPDCAKTCFIENIASVIGDCPDAPLDRWCMCSQVSFQKLLIGCVVGKCGPEDTKAAMDTTVETCNAAAAEKGEHWVNPFEKHSEKIEPVVPGNATTNSTTAKNSTTITPTTNGTTVPVAPKAAESGASNLKAASMVIAAAALLALL